MMHLVSRLSRFQMLAILRLLRVRQMLKLTMQNHGLAAKGVELFLDRFGCEQRRVQLRQPRAAELLQLANLAILDCCHIHGCPCVPFWGCL